MKPVQLLMLAGAGYLAWRYFGKSLTAAVIPDISVGGSVIPKGPDTSGDGKPLAPVTPPPLSAESRLTLIKAAAAGSQADALKADAAGIKLGPDAWNFYRAEATGAPIASVDLFGPEGRDVTITATEYLRRRTAAGLD
jgi:hypothetical protein